MFSVLSCKNFFPMTCIETPSLPGALSPQPPQGVPLLDPTGAPRQARDPIPICFHASCACYRTTQCQQEIGRISTMFAGT